MKLVLYYSIHGSATQYAFETPLQKWLKEEYKDWMVYDLDQYSGGDLFDYAEKLCLEANTILLVIDAQEDAPIAKISSLNNLVLNNKNKSFCLLTSGNELLKKLFSILGPERFCASATPATQKAFLRSVS